MTVILISIEVNEVETKIQIYLHHDEERNRKMMTLLLLEGNHKPVTILARHGIVIDPPLVHSRGTPPLHDATEISLTRIRVHRDVKQTLLFANVT